MDKTILAVAAAILLAGAAFAQQESGSSQPPKNPAESNAPGDPWANQTNTSLTDAIAAVEDAIGGKILEIRFLKGIGKGYEAVVAKKHELINVRENPLTKHVTVITVEETPAWMLDWKLRADIRSIEKAKVPLAEAVKTAEAIAHAPAIDAGLAKPLTPDNAVLAYNIEVAKNGKPERVVIDATTNSVIANPDGLLDPWTPEKLVEKTVQELHE